MEVNVVQPAGLQFYDSSSLLQHCYEQLWRKARLFSECYDPMTCSLRYPCDACREYMDRRLRRLRESYEGRMRWERCPSCGVSSAYLWTVGCENPECVNYHVARDSVAWCPF